MGSSGDGICCLRSSMHISGHCGNLQEIHTSFGLRLACPMHAAIPHLYLPFCLCGTLGARKYFIFPSPSQCHVAQRAFDNPPSPMLPDYYLETYPTHQTMATCACPLLDNLLHHTTYMHTTLGARPHKSHDGAFSARPVVPVPFSLSPSLSLQ